ncbi:MAG: 30S ribosomal protein S9 [Nitrososphaerota archaeon]
MSKKHLGVFTGKRKTSVARLVIRPGSGTVRINNVPIDIFENEIFRQKVLTPLYLAPDIWKKYDFEINVKGGGMISTAEASAIAIARALATIQPKIKEKIISYDRNLLVGDPRRTEPKKPGRRSARRFKQKSYR